MTKKTAELTNKLFLSRIHSQLFDFSCLSNSVGHLQVKGLTYFLTQINLVRNAGPSKSDWLMIGQIRSWLVGKELQLMDELNKSAQELILSLVYRDNSHVAFIISSNDFLNKIKSIYHTESWPNPHGPQLFASLEKWQNELNLALINKDAWLEQNILLKDNILILQSALDQSRFLNQLTTQNLAALTEQSNKMKSDVDAIFKEIDQLKRSFS
jgi:hypothetical protein